MLSMDRNTNLEEIENDAPFGVPYLAHQTLRQKIVFYGIMVATIGLLLYVNLGLKLDLNPYAKDAIALIPAAFAVLFGCNYNQDMSVFRYLMHTIKKPGEVYRYKSTEDIDYIKSEMQKTKLDDDAKIAQQAGVTSAHTKNRIAKFAVIVIIFMAFILALGIYKDATADNGLHHTIEEVTP